MVNIDVPASVGARPLDTQLHVWDQNSLRYGVRSQAFFDVVSIALMLRCNLLSLSSGVSAAILLIHGYFSAGCSLASLSWAVSAASLYLHVVAE